MSDERIRVVGAVGLVIGALFGMAGTFARSPELRGLWAWGITRRTDAIREPLEKA